MGLLHDGPCNCTLSYLILFQPTGDSLKQIGESGMDTEQLLSCLIHLSITELMHKHHNISLHLVNYVLNVRPRGHWIGIDKALPTSAKENIKTINFLGKHSWATRSTLNVC